MSEATSMESNQGEVRRSATVLSIARFPTPTEITNPIRCRLNGFVILIILATNVIADDIIEAEKKRAPRIVEREREHSDIA